MYGCNLRYTHTPGSNTRSDRCLSACCFIRFCALSNACLTTFMVLSRSCMTSSASVSLESLGIYGICNGGRYPYKASNGVLSKDEWNVVLYHHSAKDTHLTQVCGLSITIHLKYPSKHRLTTSVWPSDCGWYAVDNPASIPCKFKNSVQNELRNIGSLSDTMDLGHPCSLNTLSRNTCATSLAENG
ncbi:hypothetical protein HanLR1_Chr10g0366601 [Helianthus annuus]|nr:hypothetical protein HanLR1_Chr10g0366601 [Helianthus annuus]